MLITSKTISGSKKPVQKMTTDLTGTTRLNLAPTTINLNLVVPLCKVAVFLARVLEGLAKSFVVNDVFDVGLHFLPRLQVLVLRSELWLLLL